MTRQTPFGRNIFISCGEASGDRYAAQLVRALRERDPGVQVTALGGEAVEAAGARIIESSDAISVMGFTDVVRALPALWRAKRRIWRHLDEGGIDLVIPIDFPGFNLKVAARAKQRGLPVYYLIPPQLWAWGGWRVGGLRRGVDRVGTILPFEPEFFSSRGLDVHHLGHPLMEDYGRLDFDDLVLRRELRFADRGRPLILGLLPGSRRQEIDRLVPIMKVMTGLLRARLAPRPVECVLSAAPGFPTETLHGLLKSGIEVTQTPLPELLPKLDLAVVCSGTASLETALAGVPHEIVYLTSELNYFLARRLVRVERIGLANLITGEDIAREHLQGAVKPLPLSAALAAWAELSGRRENFYTQCVELRTACGRPGVWRRAADDILDFLDDRETRS